MVKRLTWLAAAAGLVLALLRMERLLRSATQGPPWQLVLVAALLLGGVITWVALSYRARLWGVVAANVAGLMLATIRIAAPDTAILALVPTPATIGETVREIAFGFELIRFGTAPVVPVAGIILLLTWLFWVFGALIVWSITSGRPILAVIPGIILYLQLATMDRLPPGRGWTAAFVVVLIGSLLAVAHDERTEGTGRLRDRDNRYVPAVSAGRPAVFVIAVIAIAVLGSGLFAQRIPESGLLNWRSRTGFGNGIFGGVSYNLFVGVQQQLTSQSDTPVFTATVEGDIDPSELYWKLIALENFDGTNWFPRRSLIREPEPGAPWENPDQQFIGPTVTVLQDITISSLRQNYLPAAYTPVGLASQSEILTESFRIREDGAIRFDALTFEGLNYQITSQVPEPNLEVLASADGSLSPIFTEARENGVFSGQAAGVADRPLPEDIEDFLELPTNIADGTIGPFARELTEVADTDFERALFIEAFLRGDNFTYDATIDPGHSAQSIEDWLMDPDSPNYHTGYCEQFATAMAVMARTLGMPSRVILGFAPGDVDANGTVTVRQSDAHSWVEIWFPEQGWVRFDPTPRRQADNPGLVNALGFDPRNYVPIPEDNAEEVAENVERAIEGLTRDDLLAQIGDEATPDALVPGLDLAEEPSGVSLPVMVAAGIVAMAAVIPGLKWWRRRRRLERLKSGDISGAWNEIIDQLTDLGTAVPSSATPMEVAKATHDSMEPLALTYSRIAYGPSTQLSDARVSWVETSYRKTEQHLRDRHSRLRRILRWFNPASLRRYRSG